MSKNISVKCPDCHKYWEENYRGEEYCPECGQTKQQAAARLRRDRKRVQTERKQVQTENKAAKQARITAKIDNDPKYGYVKRLTEFFAEFYEIEVKISFRNIKNATSTHYRTEGYHLHKYGYECINWFYDNYFLEWPSVSWMWDHTMTGIEALWALVLHEFAHTLADHLYGRVRGRSHKSEFVKALRQLQQDFPFSDCQGV